MSLSNLPIGNENTGLEQQLEVIQSSLAYLDQLIKNRFVIETMYFERNIEKANEHLLDLQNGIAWLEYTVFLMEINYDPDEKNRLFGGLKEAIELQDWLTIIDFLANPLPHYIEIVRKGFIEKYAELKRG